VTATAHDDWTPSELSRFAINVEYEVDAIRWRGALWGPVDADFEAARIDPTDRDRWDVWDDECQEDQP
jgi:hypothetical protein